MSSRPHLLAIPAGLLIAAGLPPWGWWPLTLVGIALWFELIAGKDRRRRFSISFIVGLAWTLPATLWMFDLTAAGWPVAVAIFSLGAGVVGIATPPDGFTIRSFAFTAALVLIELIRWNYPFGGTPIATYAMVGVSTPFWITARTFGSPGLTVVVAWAGLAIGQLVQRRRDTVTAAGMVIVLVVGGMLGSYRVETVDTVDVAVVQGGGPQNTRADVCTTRAVFERHMAASETIDREVDLVVWPEDVVHPAADGRPTPARCSDELLRTTEATDRLTRLATDLDAVVVSGWQLRELCARGADPEAKKSTGGTALHTAADTNQTAVLGVLVVAAAYLRVDAERARLVLERAPVVAIRRLGAGELCVPAVLRRVGAARGGGDAERGEHVELGWQRGTALCGGRRYQRFDRYGTVSG